MKTNPSKAIKCNACRDLQYILSNLKGKVQAKVCKCFVCKNCQGTGRTLLEDSEGISRILECQCTDFTKRIKLFNNAGIPGKFVYEGLDNYEVNPPRHRSLKDALAIDKRIKNSIPSTKGSI